MAVIPAGYAQINFRFVGSGLVNPAECTIGVILTSYGGDVTTLAEDMYTLFSETLLTQMNESIDLKEVLAKEGPNDLGPQAIFTGTENGGNASQGSSSAVALLIHKNTSAGGRPNRGRMYLPGASEAAVAPNGELTAAFQTSLQAQAQAFHNGFGDLSLTPVLLHGPDSPVANPTQITSLVVDARVATQRRRQRR